MSKSQLSIARHFGRINLQGVEYIYNDADDTLTKAELINKEAKAEIEARKYNRLRDEIDAQREAGKQFELY